MIYEQLQEIETAVRDALSVVTTIGKPAKDTPPGMYAWVEPVNDDESALGNNIEHAVGGDLEFRVQVRISGSDLQDKIKQLCDVVDRSKTGSVQRALLGAAFEERLTIYGSQWGIDPTDGEWGSSVRCSVLLLPEEQE